MMAPTALALHFDNALATLSTTLPRVRLPIPEKRPPVEGAGAGLSGGAGGEADAGVVLAFPPGFALLLPGLPVVAVLELEWCW